MRFISLLLALLILGYLLMSSLNTTATDPDQAVSRPKETVERVEQQFRQAADDYQQKLDDSVSKSQ
ncbi:MAG: hypothetical protein OEY43_08095 [Gammaproteobacteria bacterium]|nr:hypothetical protein [Gammaproteobacteria bacterium]